VIFSGAEWDTLDGSSFLLTVSEGEGAGLLGELQPGFAKINTSAKTRMPTTTPKILRIFMTNSWWFGDVNAI